MYITYIYRNVADTILYTKKTILGANIGKCRIVVTQNRCVCVRERIYNVYIYTKLTFENIFVHIYIIYTHEYSTPKTFMLVCFVCIDSCSFCEPLRFSKFFLEKMEKMEKMLTFEKFSSGKFFHIYELNPFLDHFASNFVNLT